LRAGNNPNASHHEYRNFEIEWFEAGKGLWHARFRRSDLEPLLIDGIPLVSIEVGFAWPNPRSLTRYFRSIV
jgi:hypothetical protein